MCIHIQRIPDTYAHTLHLSLSLYHAREIFLAASNDLTMKLALRVCVACIWAQWTIVSIWFILMLYVFLIMSRTMHVQNYIYIYITHYIHTRMPTYLLPTYLPTDRQTDIHTCMHFFHILSVLGGLFLTSPGWNQLVTCPTWHILRFESRLAECGRQQRPQVMVCSGRFFFCHQIIRWSGYPWPAFMARISFGTWTKAWWRRLAARRLVA